MSDNQMPAQHVLPPHAQLIQMGTASWVSGIVFGAAKLGLANHLADGPRSAAELAGPTGTHAPSLHRLMRTLASLGILTERDAQRFALTPLGEALKTGAPGSARATLIAFCGQGFWHGWEEIEYSLRTGKTGFDKALGVPLFEYLRQRPEEASYFSEAMVGFHGDEPPAVAAAYDFSGFNAVVDVGGATGNLLAAILSRHAGPRGVLFDRPHVVGDAPALLEGCRHGWASHDRRGRFLRDRSSRRRRLSALTHRPRLDGGEVSDHPRPLPPSHQARRPSSDY